MSCPPPTLAQFAAVAHFFFISAWQWHLCSFAPCNCEASGEAVCLLLPHLFPFFSHPVMTKISIHICMPQWLSFSQRKEFLKTQMGVKKKNPAIKQKWKMWEIRSTDYSTHANEGHVQNHRQVYWKWYLETVCDSSDSCKCALWDGLTQKNSMRVFQACVVPWFIPVLWHNL